MLLRPMSDIHLEFGLFAVPHLDTDKDTILILAGDIGTPHRMIPRVDLGVFLEACGAQFKQVLYVMGNHEHYGGSLLRTKEVILTGFNYNVPSNVHLLDNSEFIDGNVVFLGCTLWTEDNNSPLTELDWSLMSDKREIRTGSQEKPYDRYFYYKDMVREHRISWMYLRETTKKYKELGKTVVWLNHHSISRRSIPEIYVGNNLNPFFTSNHDEEIMELEPDLIIHGHTHNSLDYMIGKKTRVVCNPRGYVDVEENSGFNPEMVIDI